MSAPSKILPLRPPVRQEGQPRNAPRTSCRRQYRRCAPLRPTAPTSRGSLPFLSAIAPPFLPFCEQERSWCAYELVRAPRRNYRRRWRPSRRPVRPRSTRRAYRRRLRRRSSSSRRARPPRDPKRQPHSIAVRNPSASPMREPEALHTSPMSPSPEICAPKTFFVLPTPYTLPLKAIAVLSTSFSPLEQS